METGYNLEEFKNIKASAKYCYLGECNLERQNVIIILFFIITSQSSTFYLPTKH